MRKNTARVMREKDIEREREREREREIFYLCQLPG